MQSHLIINGVDYTPYIVQDSYKINTNDKFESWQDGNMVEHRVIVAQKVSGSVQIVCSEQGDWLRSSKYISDLAAATDNGVLTALVFVPSLNMSKVVDCYYENTNVNHLKSTGGEFTDVFELKITER